MNINTMRQNIKRAQPGLKGTGAWVDKLSDAQVIAVHARLVRESKIKV